MSKGSKQIFLKIIQISNHYVKNYLIQVGYYGRDNILAWWHIPLISVLRAKAGGE